MTQRVDNDHGEPDTGKEMTLRDFAQALIDQADIIDASLRGYERENTVLRNAIFQELKPSDCSCEHNADVVRAVHNGDRVPDIH
jgi:hypothetical protein